MRNLVSHVNSASALKYMIAFLANLVVISLPSYANAFTCHRLSNGKLTFEISKIDPIETEGKIYRAPLIVENNSEESVAITMELSSIDSLYLYDDFSQNAKKQYSSPEVLRRDFVVKPNAKYESTIAFAVKGAYLDAHYPIRARFSYSVDSKEETVELHPVFATKINEKLPSSETFKTLNIEGAAFLKLNGSKGQTYVPYWRQFNGDYQLLPVRWSGSEPNSGASLNPCVMSRGGVQRESWSLHPPYKGGAGVVGARFAIVLPQAPHIELRFYSAMRDVFLPEPPTDGVEFRVYASHILTEGNGDVSCELLNKIVQEAPKPENLVFSKQYDGVNWLENSVDLSKFSGQTILLTFETDPGAAGDTTCDNCFWGDLAILINPEKGKIASDKERAQWKENNRLAFLEFSKSAPASTPSEGVALPSPDSRGFVLDANQYAVVTLGNYGVCDGWIAIGSPERFVQIDGVRAQYQGVNVGYDRPYAPCKVDAEFVESSNLERFAYAFTKAHRQDFIGDLPTDADVSPKDDALFEPSDENELKCYISKTTGGLAFRFVASKNVEISSLQFGPFSSLAKRIYFGQGHCVVDPQKPFTIDGDGFACSTSHVGFDFENGLSILEATTRPVDSFVVNPALNVYSIVVSPDTRLTLLSGENGALDCAIRYAPGFDKKPAPLVPQKAGRFVFDFWGGSYGGVLQRMKTFVDYGLTDSMLIQHAWQHYGYDVRLPDIWPPNPAQGTLEELKATQEFCDKHGIPFGLHDNYIDFYPDADGFTYDDIIINPDGQPQKAWYNPGPDVQSYRFNPLKIFPYANRNLDLIRKDLMQTAYFTDVFSSIHIMNFYDRKGSFHSRAETLDCWNKYFDLVRDKFNNNAITVSESGSDALIGHLEGADGILRRITKTQENFSCVIDCKDESYVPWGDSVYHDKFILHGVGYSDRYQGGVSRALRGIESDDYISSEALLGHAIMADLGMSTRGVVRKYWLMQSLARSLALDAISKCEFVDDNIHRVKVVWKSGAVVYVNRDVEDWKLESESIPQTNEPLILPRFGFWACNSSGTQYGGIVRIKDQVVELRVDENSYFVNGREKTHDDVVPIRPTFENVNVVDAATLTGDLVWNADKPTDKKYAPFLHLERPKTWWGDKPELNVLPLPNYPKSSDQWNGREIFKLSITLSEDLLPGYYNILCGLFDPQTGYRVPLLGPGESDKRYLLGGVKVDGKGDQRRVEFVPNEDLHGVDLRLIPNENSTNFGVCQTKGAFRFEQTSKDVAILTPLPDEPSFEANLTSAFFANGTFKVVGLNRDGEIVDTFSLKSLKGTMNMTIDSGKVFQYRIVKE